MPSHAHRAEWFVSLRRHRAPRVRLYCLPHAGGGASTYTSWSDALSGVAEVCSIQFPGRENRLSEPPFTQMPPLTKALAAAVAAAHDGTPFAIFGHSLGALVAFELAHALIEQGLPPPIGLFVAGCPAPHLHVPPRSMHDLPDDEFTRELQRLEGTPAEVFESSEIMSLVMPALRADFTIFDLYQHVDRAPLACPINAFGGMDDPDVSRSHLEGWRQQTSSAFTLRMYPGGHFFLESARAALLSALTSDLEALLGSSRG